jgi:hypothetical protein
LCPLDLVQPPLHRLDLLRLLLDQALKGCNVGSGSALGLRR